jgi:cold shock CspA family protein
MPYFYGAGRRPAPSLRLLSRPTAPRGSAGAGRVARLLVGQSYGFIRTPGRSDIYFHRADMSEGRSFNTLRVGDAVTFVLLDDRVSGPRAVQVVPRRQP